MRKLPQPICGDAKNLQVEKMAGVIWQPLDSVLGDVEDLQGGHGSKHGREGGDGIVADVEIAQLVQAGKVVGQGVDEVVSECQSGRKRAGGRRRPWSGAPLLDVRHSSATLSYSPDDLILDDICHLIWDVLDALVTEVQGVKRRLCTWACCSTVSTRRLPLFRAGCPQSQLDNGREKFIGRQYRSRGRGRG